MVDSATDRSVDLRMVVGPTNRRRPDRAIHHESRGDGGHDDEDVPITYLASQCEDVGGSAVPSTWWRLSLSSPNHWPERLYARMVDIFDRFDEEGLDFPTEKTVMAIAAGWSLDPTTLGGPDDRLGVLGRLR